MSIPKSSRTTPLLKGIASFVAFCFTFTTLAWSAPNLELPIHKNEISVSPLAYEIEIPESLGTIKKRFTPDFRDGSGEPAAIIHIQDAHANYEAQVNTKKILEHLKKEYGMDLVFLEGGIEKFNAEQIQFLKDPERAKKTADLLTRDGVISGAELFLLEEWLGGTAAQTDAYGVEDPKLYRDNLDTFQTVIEKKSLSGPFLNHVQAQIFRESSRRFNKKLQDFFKHWVFYQNTQSEWIRHIGFLHTYAREILNLDLNDPANQWEWPQLLRLFKLQGLEKKINREKARQDIHKLDRWLVRHGTPPRLILGVQRFDPLQKEKNQNPWKDETPRHFLEGLYLEMSPKGFSFKHYPYFSRLAGVTILQNELEAEELLGETNRLTKLLLRRLAIKKEERELLFLYQDSLLLEKLFSLELAREDYEQVRKRIKRIRPSVFIRRLQAVNPKSSAISPQSTDHRVFLETTAVDRGLPAVDLLFDHALAFYSTAKKREEVIFQKTLSRMKELKNPKAVLITGGFHSEGLHAQFKENGISYVEITPHLSELTNNKTYQGMMTMQADFLTLRSNVQTYGPRILASFGASHISRPRTDAWIMTAARNAYSEFARQYSGENFLNRFQDEFGNSPAAQKHGFRLKRAGDSLALVIGDEKGREDFVRHPKNRSEVFAISRRGLSFKPVKAQRLLVNVSRASTSIAQWQSTERRLRPGLKRLSDQTWTQPLSFFMGQSENTSPVTKNTTTDIINRTLSGIEGILLKVPPITAAIRNAWKRVSSVLDKASSLFGVQNSFMRLNLNVLSFPYELFSRAHNIGLFSIKQFKNYKTTNLLVNKRAASRAEIRVEQEKYERMDNSFAIEITEKRLSLDEILSHFIDLVGAQSDLAKKLQALWEQTGYPWPQSKRSPNLDRFFMKLSGWEEELPSWGMIGRSFQIPLLVKYLEEIATERMAEFQREAAIKGIEAGEGIKVSNASLKIEKRTRQIQVDISIPERSRSYQLIFPKGAHWSIISTAYRFRFPWLWSVVEENQLIGHAENRIQIFNSSSGWELTFFDRKAGLFVSLSINQEQGKVDAAYIPIADIDISPTKIAEHRAELRVGTGEIIGYLNQLKQETLPEQEKIRAALQALIQQIEKFKDKEKVTQEQESFLKDYIHLVIFGRGFQGYLRLKARNLAAWFETRGTFLFLIPFLRKLAFNHPPVLHHTLTALDDMMQMKEIDFNSLPLGWEDFVDDILRRYYPKTIQAAWQLMVKNSENEDKFLEELESLFNDPEEEVRLLVTELDDQQLSFEKKMNLLAAAIFIRARQGQSRSEIRHMGQETESEEADLAQTYLRRDFARDFLLKMPPDLSGLSQIELHIPEKKVILQRKGSTDGKREISFSFDRRYDFFFRVMKSDKIQTVFFPVSLIASWASDLSSEKKGLEEMTVAVEDVATWAIYGAAYRFRTRIGTPWRLVKDRASNDKEVVLKVETWNPDAHPAPTHTRINSPALKPGEIQKDVALSLNQELSIPGFASPNLFYIGLSQYPIAEGEVNEPAAVGMPKFMISIQDPDIIFFSEKEWQEIIRQGRPHYQLVKSKKEEIQKKKKKNYGGILYAKMFPGKGVLVAYHSKKNEVLKIQWLGEGRNQGEKILRIIGPEKFVRPIEYVTPSVLRHFDKRSEVREARLGLSDPPSLNPIGSRAEMRTNLADILSQNKINPDEFTEVIYPASGNYDDVILAKLKSEVFPHIHNYHLISLSYKESENAGAFVRRNIFDQLGSQDSAQVHLYPEDYYKVQLELSSEGKRIWIDKGPGWNGEMRQEKLYQTAVEKSHIRPGDLVLTVPTGIRPYRWKNEIASEVQIWKDDYWNNWRVSIVTEEDITAIQSFKNVSSVRAELRNSSPQSIVDSPQEEKKNLWTADRRLSTEVFRRSEVRPEINISGTPLRTGRSELRSEEGEAKKKGSGLLDRRKFGIVLAIAAAGAAGWVFYPEPSEEEMVVTSAADQFKGILSYMKEHPGEPLGEDHIFDAASWVLQGYLFSGQRWLKGTGHFFFTPTPVPELPRDWVDRLTNRLLRKRLLDPKRPPSHFIREQPYLLLLDAMTALSHVDPRTNWDDQLEMARFDILGWKKEQDPLYSRFDTAEKMLEFLAGRPDKVTSEFADEIHLYASHLYLYSNFQDWFDAVESIQSKTGSLPDKKPWLDFLGKEPERQAVTPSVYFRLENEPEIDIFGEERLRLSPPASREFVTDLTKDIQNAVLDPSRPEDYRKIQERVKDYFSAHEINFKPLAEMPELRSKFDAWKRSFNEVIKIVAGSEPLQRKLAEIENTTTYEWNDKKGDRLVLRWNQGSQIHIEGKNWAGLPALYEQGVLGGFSPLQIPYRDERDFKDISARLNRLLFEKLKLGPDSFLGVEISQMAQRRSSYSVRIGDRRIESSFGGLSGDLEKYFDLKGIEFKPQDSDNQEIVRQVIEVALSDRFRSEVREARMGLSDPPSLTPIGSRAEVRRETFVSRTSKNLGYQNPMVLVQKDSSKLDVSNFAGRSEVRPSANALGLQDDFGYQNPMVLVQKDSSKLDVSNSAGRSEVRSLTDIESIQSKPIKEYSLEDFQTLNQIAEDFLQKNSQYQIPDIFPNDVLNSSESGILNLASKVSQESGETATAFFQVLALAQKVLNVEAHREKGRKRRQTYARSLILANAALQFEPKNKALLTEKATLLSHLGDRDQALKIFQELDESQEGNGKNDRAVRAGMGHAHLEWGRSFYRDFLLALGEDQFGDAYEAWQRGMQELKASEENLGVIIGEYKRNKQLHAQPDISQVPRSYKYLSGMEMIIADFYLAAETKPNAVKFLQKDFLSEALHHAVKAFGYSMDALKADPNNPNPIRAYTNSLIKLTEVLKAHLTSASVRASTILQRMENLLKNIQRDLSSIGYPIPEESKPWIKEVQRLVKEVQININAYRTVDDTIKSQIIFLARSQLNKKEIPPYTNLNDLKTGLQIAVMAHAGVDPTVAQPIFQAIWTHLAGDLKFDLADFSILKGYLQSKEKDPLTIAQHTREFLPPEISQDEIIQRLKSGRFHFLGLAFENREARQKRSESKSLAQPSRPPLELFKKEQIQAYLKQDSEKLQELQKKYQAVTPWITEEEYVREFKVKLARLGLAIEDFRAKAKNMLEAQGQKKLKKEELVRLHAELKEARVGEKGQGGYVVLRNELSEILNREEVLAQYQINREASLVSGFMNDVKVLKDEFAFPWLETVQDQLVEIGNGIQSLKHAKNENYLSFSALGDLLSSARTVYEQTVLLRENQTELKQINQTLISLGESIRKLTGVVDEDLRNEIEDRLVGIRDDFSNAALTVDFGQSLRKIKKNIKALSAQVENHLESLREKLDQIDSQSSEVSTYLTEITVLQKEFRFPSLEAVRKQLEETHQSIQSLKNPGDTNYLSQDHLNELLASARLAYGQAQKLGENKKGLKIINQEIGAVEKAFWELKDNVSEDLKIDAETWFLAIRQMLFAETAIPNDFDNQVRAARGKIQELSHQVRKLSDFIHRRDHLAARFSQAAREFKEIEKSWDYLKVPESLRTIKYHFWSFYLLIFVKTFWYIFTNHFGKSRATKALERADQVLQILKAEKINFDHLNRYEVLLPEKGKVVEASLDRVDQFIRQIKTQHPRHKINFQLPKPEEMGYQELQALEDRVEELVDSGKWNEKDEEEIEGVNQTALWLWNKRQSLSGISPEAILEYIRDVALPLLEGPVDQVGKVLHSDSSRFLIRFWKAVDESYESEIYDQGRVKAETVHKLKASFNDVLTNLKGGRIEFFSLPELKIKIETLPASLTDSEKEKLKQAAHLVAQSKWQAKYPETFRLSPSLRLEKGYLQGSPLEVASTIVSQSLLRLIEKSERYKELATSERKSAEGAGENLPSHWLVKLEVESAREQFYLEILANARLTQEQSRELKALLQGAPEFQKRFERLESDLDRLGSRLSRPARVWLDDLKERYDVWKVKKSPQPLAKEIEVPRIGKIPFTSTNDLVQKLNELSKTTEHAFASFYATPFSSNSFLISYQWKGSTSPNFQMIDITDLDKSNALLSQIFRVSSGGGPGQARRAEVRRETFVSRTSKNLGYQNPMVLVQKDSSKLDVSNSAGRSVPRGTVEWTGPEDGPEQSRRAEVRTAIHRRKFLYLGGIATAGLLGWSAGLIAKETGKETRLAIRDFLRTYVPELHKGRQTDSVFKKADAIHSNLRAGLEEILSSRGSETAEGRSNLKNLIPLGFAVTLNPPEVYELKRAIRQNFRELPQPYDKRAHHDYGYAVELDQIFRDPSKSRKGLFNPRGEDNLRGFTTGNFGGGITPVAFSFYRDPRSRPKILDDEEFKALNPKDKEDITARIASNYILFHEARHVLDENLSAYKNRPENGLAELERAATVSEFFAPLVDGKFYYRTGLEKLWNNTLYASVTDSRIEKWYAAGSKEMLRQMAGIAGIKTGGVKQDSGIYRTIVEALKLKDPLLVENSFFKAWENNWEPAGYGPPLTSDWYHRNTGFLEPDKIENSGIEATTEFFSREPHKSGSAQPKQEKDPGRSEVRIQAEVDRAALLKEAARARAVQMHRYNRELLNFFENWRQLKRQENTRDAAAVLAGIQSYAARLQEHAGRIVAEDESPQPEEKRIRYAEIQNIPGPQLKKLSQEFESRIKSFYPLFVEAYEARDGERLDRLNREVVAWHKARIKTQLLQTRYHLLKGNINESAVLALLMAVYRSYLRLSQEYAWRWRRAVARVATERIKVVGRHGQVATVYDYENFRIFQNPPSADAPEGRVVIRQNRWKKEELEDGRYTYLLRPVNIKLENLDTALRSQIHTLLSQEEDYGQILFRINALDYVIDLLKTYGENLSGYHQEEVEVNLGEVLEGPGGLQSGITDQKRRALDNINAALPALRAGRLQEAIGLLEGATELLKERLKDIEDKKTGVQSRTDHLAHQIRLKESGRAAQELETLIPDKRFREGQQLLELVYTTYYLPIASSVVRYELLKSVVTRLRDHFGRLADFPETQPQERTRLLTRVHHDLEALKQITRSRFRSEIRAEVRAAASVGFAHHFRAKSIVQHYDKVFLRGPAYKRQRGETDKDMPKLIDVEKDLAQARRINKLDRAITYLLEQGVRLKDPEMIQRTRHLKEFTTILGLDMPTHLLFYDSRARRGRVYHLDRRGSVIYFPLRFLDSLERESSGIGELAVYLDRAQRWLDAYQEFIRKQTPAPVIYIQMREAEKNFPAIDRKILTGRDPNYLLAGISDLRALDEKIQKKEIFPEIRKLRRETSALQIKLEKKRKSRRPPAREDYSDLALRYGRLAHLEENVGLHANAIQSYRAQVAALHNLQTVDTGLLPIQIQERIIMILILAGLHKEFLQELRVFLTGAGWPQKLGTANRQLEAQEGKGLNPIFVSRRKEQLKADYHYILQIQEEEARPQGEQPRIQEYIAEVNRLFRDAKTKLVTPAPAESSGNDQAPGPKGPSRAEVRRETFVSRTSKNLGYQNPMVLVQKDSSKLDVSNSAGRSEVRSDHPIEAKELERIKKLLTDLSAPVTEEDWKSLEGYTVNQLALLGIQIHQKEREMTLPAAKEILGQRLTRLNSVIRKMNQEHPLRRSVPREPDRSSGSEYGFEQPRRAEVRTGTELISAEDQELLQREYIPWKRLQRQTQAFLIRELFSEIHLEEPDAQSLTRLTQKDFREKKLNVLGGKTLSGLYANYERSKNKPKKESALSFMLRSVGLAKLKPDIEEIKSIQKFNERIKQGDFSRGKNETRQLGWGVWEKVSEKLQRELVEALARQTEKKVLDLNRADFSVRLNSIGFGNDTIDRYPLCRSGVLKILCITSTVWGEVHKAFASFRRLFKCHALRKVESKSLCPKIKKELKNSLCHAAYEPSNAMACNDADWRRWVRVKEWFNDHLEPERVNFGKGGGHIIEFLKS